MNFQILIIFRWSYLFWCILYEWYLFLFKVAAMGPELQPPPAEQYRLNPSNWNPAKIHAYTCFNNQLKTFLFDLRCMFLWSYKCIEEYSNSRYAVPAFLDVNQRRLNFLTFHFSSSLLSVVDYNIAKRRNNIRNKQFISLER